jgi:hypothetical protein
MNIQFTGQTSRLNNELVYFDLIRFHRKRLLQKDGAYSLQFQQWIWYF